MVELEEHGLDLVFQALSDRTRRKILRSLTVDARSVGEIAKPFSISLAGVSKHLKVLEAAKLVTRERRGTTQLVRLNAAAMRPAEAWLAYYERFWTQQMDALQTYLEGADHD